ncbi:putative ribonuclease H-like domain-containing protein [Tanacetum coccineum]
MKLSGRILNKKTENLVNSGRALKSSSTILLVLLAQQLKLAKISEALEDESWVDAMQEELLQFEIQKVWILVDLPYGKKAIGFLDPKYHEKVYKVVKALYGLHQAPRAWYATLSTFLLKNGYRRGTIDKTLFLRKDKHDIILVQVYVDDIIFGSTKKSWCDEFEALMKSRFQMSSIGELTFFLGLQTASTPIETQKPLVKDEEASDVDVHLYRYLKGKPKLGLWYPRESSFDLESYSDSDYAGANLDRKSTTGGCQFLGRRLITWQCKKQTIVATSTTEAEYVAAASCCGQVLWIQNQINSWPLIKSKKIGSRLFELGSSKNSLVKHFEDMRLYRPSKEYLQVWFDPPRDMSMSCLTTKGLRNNGVMCASIPDTYIVHSLFGQSRKIAIYVPLDHFPVNSLTSKVFSFMIKKGKHFSGKVTPLFDTMLVQPTQDEGASSERLSDEQPSPSPAPTSEVPNESLPDSSSAQPSEVPFEQQPDPSPRPSPRPSPKPSPTPIVTDSIPEPTGENLGDHSSNDASLSGNEDDMTLQNVYDLCLSLCKQVSDQAKEIKLLKAKITKLKKQAKPVIKHHKEYLKSVSLQQRFPRKSFSKKHRVHKESVSKQGRKKAKGESSVQRDPLFDVMPEDKIDHMETENAQSEGRTREIWMKTRS